MKRNVLNKVKSLVLILVLILFVTASFSESNESSKNKIHKIVNEMITITKETKAKLKKINSAQTKRVQISDKIKEIVNPHRKRMVTLSKQMEANPSMDKFSKTKEWKTLEKKLNNELQELKSIAFSLLKETHRTVDYGTFNTDELLAGDKITFKHITTKYYFLRNYFLGTQNITNSDRQNTIRMLDALHVRALKRNRVAISTLNEVLEDVLKAYPKDVPGAQFNRGILLIDLGRTEEGKRWLQRAANQGMKEATMELERLK